MPMPRRMRAVGRTVNPYMVPLARRVPPLAVVHHVGRRSGRAYQTPVMAFPTAGGWVAALPYGSDVEWLRNALGAGAVELTRFGTTHRVREVRRIERAAGERLVPGWARQVMRTVNVRDYVLFVAGP